MKQTVRFKYGTVLKVLTIINGVLLALGAVVVIFIQDLLLEVLGQTAGVDLSELSFIFYFVGIMLGVIAVLLFIASAKVPYSKGWNIFIIAYSGLSILGSITEFEFFSLLFAGAMLVFAILNVSEAQKRQFQAPSGEASGDLETKLKALNDLYDKGLISSEEYQKSRQEAIGKTE